MKLKLKIISIFASIVIFATGCNQLNDQKPEVPPDGDSSGITSQKNNKSGSSRFGGGGGGGGSGGGGSGGGGSGGGGSGGGAQQQQNQGNQQQQNNQQNNNPPKNQNNGGAISYDSTPQSVSAYTFNFDEGMEKNLSVTDYVVWANANPTQAVKNLSFTLANGATINPGDTANYTLSLAFEAVDAANPAAAKVKIKPTFQVKNPNKNIDTFSSLQNQLIKPYFTKKQALNYILEKVKGQGPIQAADGTTFASSWYARAQKLKATPNDLFNDAIIAPYKNAYNKPGAYQMQNIGIFLSDSNNITANDLTGTLTVYYIIASEHGAADINSAERSDSSGTVNATHFKKVTKQDIENLLYLKKNNNANKNSWNQQVFNLALFQQNPQISNQWVLEKNDDVINKFKTANSSGYWVQFNGVGIEFDTELLLAGNNNCSKLEQSGPDILIENIVFSKSKGEDNLTITVQLCGGNIEFTRSPATY